MRTAEWNNERARCETAAEAEAAGDGTLANLLRRRDSSQLRKAQILHLCHLWRYTSNVWRLRKGATNVASPRGGAEGRQGAGTPAAVQSASTRAALPGPSRPPSPQPLLGVAVAPSLQQALQAAVVPHCQQAAYWLEGPQMRACVASVNQEVFDLQRRLVDVQHGAVMLKRLQGAFQAKRLALRGWVTTVRAEQRRHPGQLYDGMTPAQYVRDEKQAWMALDGDEGVAEQLMRLLAAAWGGAGKDSRRNEAVIMARAQAAGVEGEQAPHVKLWFDEMRNGFEQNLQMLSVAMALLAPFKCGELGGYILASDAVMEVMENSCRLSEAALTKRAEWIPAQETSTTTEAAPDAPLPNTVKAVSRLIEVCKTDLPTPEENSSP